MFAAYQDAVVSLASFCSTQPRCFTVSPPLASMFDTFWAPGSVFLESLVKVFVPGDEEGSAGSYCLSSRISKFVVLGRCCTV